MRVCSKLSPIYAITRKVVSHRDILAHSSGRCGCLLGWVAMSTATCPLAPRGCAAETESRFELLHQSQALGPVSFLHRGGCAAATGRQKLPPGLSSPYKSKSCARGLVAVCRAALRRDVVADSPRELQFGRHRSVRALCGRCAGTVRARSRRGPSRGPRSRAA